MTTYIHQCLIVTASMAPLARQLTAAVAGPAGEGMFVVPLSPTGAEPATHFISTGMIEDTMLAPLQSAETLHELSGVPLETCEALLASSDISDDQPEVALARLNLQLISE
ncbi:hypothetical protein H0A71_06540 [Alcaligenaceae bacterium]|nr:hypothetical protein [Alcaligenaceae bacterium]